MILAAGCKSWDKSSRPSEGLPTIQSVRWQRTLPALGQGPYVSLGFLMFLKGSLRNSTSLWHFLLAFRVCVSLSCFSWQWGDCSPLLSFISTLLFPSPFSLRGNGRLHSFYVFCFVHACVVIFSTPVTSAALQCVLFVCSASWSWIWTKCWHN